MPVTQRIETREAAVPTQAAVAQPKNLDVVSHPEGRSLMKFSFPFGAIPLAVASLAGVPNSPYTLGVGSCAPINTEEGPFLNRRVDFLPISGGFRRISPQPTI